MARPKLRRREWIVIIIGGTVLFLLGLLPLIQKGAAAYKRSENQVGQARNRLQDAQELRALIEAERSGQEAVKKKLQLRPGAFDLYAHTRRILSEVNLDQRTNLNNNPPRTGGTLEGVLVDMKGVSMDELVSFLHKMYDGGNLIVLQKLDNLEPARDGNGLDCRMTFITPDT